MDLEMLLQHLRECDCMKNYYKLILEKLLDIYERREAFKKEKEELRSIHIEPAKEYKEYVNRYDHEAYRHINAAIQKLEQQRIVTAMMDVTGKFTKVKLNIDTINLVYEFLGRASIPESCSRMKSVLERYQDNKSEVVNAIVIDFMKLLNDCKKLPYDINFDSKKLNSIMYTLCAIVSLNQETYIRNFSTAVFKDSKEFQKYMRSVVQSILYDYTDVVVEKERILEVYNLFDNPTYVLIKGNAVLKYNSSVIDLLDMNGGIAIPNAALEDIISIAVQAKRVITVENLTTYHDSSDSDCMFIYLGGFHSISKQQFLKLLFSQNKDKEYYHKGDLDVYGFSILENLKDRTGIPFKPMEMDVSTLKRYYNKGLYKELTSSDKKAMKAERLQKYRDVFDYMLEHNCKVEQESIKALELLEE